MAQSHTSIHEMLKDTPTMNESSNAIHSGTEPRLKHPNSLPLNNISAPATPSSNPSLTSPLGDSSFIKSGAAKIDTLKNWSISTYKCTRQIMLEKLGKSSRTIDSELEAQIEQLRDTQRKYLQILRLTRALSSHFHHVVQTNRMLSEAFSDLAQKSPELQG